MKERRASSDFPEHERKVDMKNGWIFLAGLLVCAGIQGQEKTNHTVLHKSRGKAILYSFLVPGLGELYLKDWKWSEWGSGKTLLMSEMTLWGVHMYLSSYSAWVRDDARALAATHAGVDWSAAKPDGYVSNIGKFADIFVYNDVQRRFTGPDGNLYPETPDNYWSWDSEKNRDKYDHFRIRSRSFKRYSEFTLYGVFVNHVISMINASRTYRRLQRDHDVHVGFSYRPLMPSGQQDVWLLQLTRRW